MIPQSCRGILGIQRFVPSNKQMYHHIREIFRNDIAKITGSSLQKI